jgi:hypothetical protein
MSTAARMALTGAPKLPATWTTTGNSATPPPDEDL